MVSFHKPLQSTIATLVLIIWSDLVATAMPPVDSHSPLTPCFNTPSVDSHSPLTPCFNTPSVDSHSPLTPCFNTPSVDSHSPLTPCFNTPSVDSHSPLTPCFNTPSIMYCDCALSFMFCRLCWLFNVYFPAEHTIVCQPTSYHLLFFTIYLGCKVHNDNNNNQ